MFFYQEHEIGQHMREQADIDFIAIWVWLRLLHKSAFYGYYIYVMLCYSQYT